MDSRTVCLAVLSLGDASGYEIRKSLESGPIGQFTDAGFGSIYPALRRLRDDGMIEGHQQSQSGRPDKTVYHITQKGKLALHDALQEEPVVERLRSDHMFRLFFAHLLPISSIESLIDERVAYYTAKLEHIRSKEPCGAKRPGADFVRGFGQALYEAGARYLQEHKHELLAAIAIDGEQVEERVTEKPPHHPNLAPRQAAE